MRERVVKVDIPLGDIPLDDGRNAGESKTASTQVVEALS